MNRFGAKAQIDAELGRSKTEDSSIIQDHLDRGLAIYGEMLPEMRSRDILIGYRSEYRLRRKRIYANIQSC